MKTTRFSFVKSFGVFAVSTALGCSVLAAEALSSEFQDLETVDAAHRPAIFDKVRGATFQLDGKCTATFVSNDGYVMTAMHCLNGLVDREYLEDMKFVLYTSNKEAIGHKYMVNISFEGKQSEVRATLIETGKGFVDQINPIYAFTKNSEKYLDIMEEKYYAAEDYAILKLDLENTPCLPVASKPAAVGDFVWSIAYPARFSAIKGRPLWTGKSAAFTSGRVTNGLLENASLAERLKGTSPEYQQAYLSVEGATLNEDNLTASVDALAGASGGALLNGDGEIVGIYAISQPLTGSAWDGYISGASVFANAQAAVQKLKASLGEEQVAKIFSCQK